LTSDEVRNDPLTVVAQETHVDAVGIRWVKVQDGTRSQRERTLLDGARVALCHEWTMQVAGSEKVAAAIAATVDPDAVFTLAARPEAVSRVFPGCEVWVPRLGLHGSVQRHWHQLLPFLHAAWASLTLERFDVVITSSHSCVNAVRTGGRPHVLSYCHTPMRYAWAWQEERSRVPPLLRPVWPGVAAALRAIDRRVARKVDTFIANSEFVAERIADAYRVRSRVVHPPVDTSFYTPLANGSRDYVLFAGRTVGYKRPDIAVEAARLAGVPIVIAGSGPLIDELQRSASDAMTFVAQPSDEELRDLYRGARALISPGVEDFGITNVEAMACGTPVLAYDGGGARDSVIPGRSGVLIGEQSVEAFALAMTELPPSWDPGPCREAAERFSEVAFRERMATVLAAI
jgi:glycosyltransferase involved in cell wall biosynthesis